MQMRAASQWVSLKLHHSHLYANFACLLKTAASVCTATLQYYLKVAVRLTCCRLFVYGKRNIIALGSVAPESFIILVHILLAAAKLGNFFK